jgi:hypothetical protein
MTSNLSTQPNSPGHSLRPLPDLARTFRAGLRPGAPEMGLTRRKAPSRPGGTCRRTPKAPSAIVRPGSMDCGGRDAALAFVPAKLFSKFLQSSSPEMLSEKRLSSVWQHRPAPWEPDAEPARGSAGFSVSPICNRRTRRQLMIAPRLPSAAPVENQRYSSLKSCATHGRRVCPKKCARKVGITQARRLSVGFRNHSESSL